MQLLFLGLAPIAGSSEAREAQVIDTILREGEWILPLRNGIVPSKPPLFHWIGAAISTSFGSVSELSVRLTSHLAALGVLLCSGLVAFRVAHLSTTVEGELHKNRVALLAPAILSLTYGFHQLSSQAMVDMTFSFFLWAALTSLAWSNPKEWKSSLQVSWASRALFWFFCAFALLARGPIGVALPLFLASVSGLYLSGWRVTLREAFRPSIGWLVFIIPCAWYYAAFLRGGEAFLARQLLFENVQRFIGGEKINTEAWWFYIPSLIRTTAPWGVLMLFGAARYSTRAKTMTYLGGFQRWAFAPTVALCAGTLLLSLASGKRHSYTLPLQPFIAIQCALFFSMFLERQGLPMRELCWRLARRVEGALSVVLAAIIVGIGIVHTVDWNYHPLEDILKFQCATLSLRIGALALVTLLVVNALRRSGTYLPYARVWVLLMALLTVTVSAGNVIKGILKGWSLVSEEILLLTKPGQSLVVIKDPFDEFFDPIFFYAHRPISVVSASDGIDRCDPSTVYVARRSQIDNDPHLIPGEIRVLATLKDLQRTFIPGKGVDISVFSCQQLLLRDTETEKTLRHAAFIQ